MPIQNRRAFGGSASSDETGGLRAVPDVLIGIDDESLQTVRTATVQLVFLWNQFVNGFKVASVSVSAGTLGDFDGEGSLYSALLTLPVNAVGQVTVTVSANHVVSEDNVYGPVEDRTFSFAYDTRPVAIANPSGSTVKSGTFFGIRV